MHSVLITPQFSKTL